MKKIKDTGSDRIVRAFLICFMLTLVIFLLNILFNNDSYGYVGILLAISAFVMIVIIRALNKLVNHAAQFFERRYYLVLAVFMLLMFTLQMLFGQILRFQPQYDFEAIYRNAIEWVQTGTFAQTEYPSANQDYFYFFPNNLGSMAFLAVFFKLGALLGITDFFAIGMTVNSMMLVLTLALSSLICRRLFGLKSAVMILILFMLCPPLYFAAAVFYTDYLSILFPVLTLYLCLRASDCRVVWQRVLWIASMGLSAAIGTQIKTTALIATIAILLSLLLTRRFKLLMAVLCAAAVSLLAVSSLLNAVIYPKHLDPQQAQRDNTPYAHWIMMGFSPGGGYNHNDYMFTRSFDDTAERDRAILDEIGHRIKGMGIGGVTRLFLYKNVRAFGDGTFAQSDFLDDAPEKKTVLHKFILYNGAFYSIYQHICTGFFIALLIFILLGAQRDAVCKENMYTALVPQLCIVGISLFLLIWEINSRYLTTMLPMFFMAAVQGVEFTAKDLKRHVNSVNRTITPGVKK